MRAGELLTSMTRNWGHESHKVFVGQDHFNLKDFLEGGELYIVFSHNRDFREIFLVSGKNIKDKEQLANYDDYWKVQFLENGIRFNDEPKTYSYRNRLVFPLGDREENPVFLSYDGEGNLKLEDIGHRPTPIDLLTPDRAQRQDFVGRANFVKINEQNERIDFGAHRASLLDQLHHPEYPDVEPTRSDTVDVSRFDRAKFLQGQTLVIGKPRKHKEHNRITLKNNSERVSRKHVALTLHQGFVKLEDYSNSYRMNRKIRLRPNLKFEPTADNVSRRIFNECHVGFNKLDDFGIDDKSLSQNPPCNFVAELPYSEKWHYKFANSGYFLESDGKGNLALYSSEDQEPFYLLRDTQVVYCESFNEFRLKPSN